MNLSQKYESSPMVPPMGGTSRLFKKAAQQGICVSAALAYEPFDPKFTAEGLGPNGACRRPICRRFKVYGRTS